MKLISKQALRNLIFVVIALLLIVEADLKKRRSKTKNLSSKHRQGPEDETDKTNIDTNTNETTETNTDTNPSTDSDIIIKAKAGAPSQNSDESTDTASSSHSVTIETLNNNAEIKEHVKKLHESPDNEHKISNELYASFNKIIFIYFDTFINNENYKKESRSCMNALTDQKLSKDVFKVIISYSKIKEKQLVETRNELLTEVCNKALDNLNIAVNSGDENNEQKKALKSIVSLFTDIKFRRRRLRRTRRLR